MVFFVPRLSAALSIVVAALFLALAVPATAGGGEADFVPGIDDLPLMPGLSGADEGTMVFDTPQGRIVEAYAGGMATGLQVFTFYDGTLPQLGWSRVGEGRFLREGEELEISIIPGEGGALTVRFALEPNRGSR